MFAKIKFVTIITIGIFNFFAFAIEEVLKQVIIEGENIFKVC